MYLHKLAALFLAVFTVASCEASIYLKIPDIDGESVVNGHEDEIELLSFSWGVRQATDKLTGQRGNRRRRGRTLPDDFVVTKLFDKSSPYLALSAATGRSLPTTTMEVARFGSQTPSTYLTYELKNVLVTSYSVNGNSTSDPPTETISFNFEEIKVTYSTPGCFDFETTDGEFGGSCEEHEIEYNFLAGV